MSHTIDTRRSLNYSLQIAWAESNSARIYDITSDTGRQGIRLAIRDIQSYLDQAQQQLDDLRDHVQDLEEVPF